MKNETSKWRGYSPKHLRPWVMNWTDQCAFNWENSQKNDVCIRYSILTLKKLK